MSADQAVLYSAGLVSPEKTSQRQRSTIQAEGQEGNLVERHLEQEGDVLLTPGVVCSRSI